VNAGIVSVVSELTRKFKYWGYSRSMWNWSPCHWSNMTVSIKCPSVELWPYGACHQLPTCSAPKNMLLLPGHTWAANGAYNKVKNKSWCPVFLDWDIAHGATVSCTVSGKGQWCHRVHLSRSVSHCER
jgi:hypothetical protein